MTSLPPKAPHRAPADLSSEAPKNWFQRLAPFRTSENLRAVFEIIVTLVPFLLIWAAMWWLISRGYWIGLLGAIPAGAFIVRLFIIQHDCGHRSLFTSRRANDWVGRFIALLTLTPYDYWRRQHAIHHAASGNLDRRGIGDVATLTVAEYEALSRFGKLKYRLYRNPVIMFGLGPAYVFLIQHRAPVGEFKKTMSWVSTSLTNLGVALLYGLMIWIVGWKVFLLVHVPSVLVGASIGVWLFYIQHQFDETHWDRTEDWSRERAALIGSSFYDLPGWLMWVTGNIGIHHVHHLSSRIPFYQLPRTLKAHPELRQIGRLTLWESFKCVRLALWCEQRRKLVPFSQRRIPATIAI